MTVHFEEKSRIAFITIEGIGDYNLFSPDEVYKPLVHAVERYRDNPALWCALITGAEGKKAFTYGGHIGSVSELRNSPSKESRGYKFAKAESIFRSQDKSVGILEWAHILHFDGLKVYKPIVMAINGPCVGAGTLLVNALADHVVAVPSTWFGLVELRWGIGGGGGAGAQMLGQLPWRIMMDMVLRGRRMDAEEALRYGFINQVVAPEKLMSAALEIAEDFVSMPPLAVQATKRLAIMSRDMPMPASRLISDLYGALIGDTSHDAKEGPKAFVEKRKPVFTGELGNLGSEHQL